jgi:hypothetical protein
MKHEPIEYFRRRERAEREAVRNAACDEARWAHQQMATAYAQLVEVEALKAGGALAPDKVIRISEALRARDGAEHRGRRRLSPDPLPFSALRV